MLIFEQGKTVEYKACALDPILDRYKAECKALKATKGNASCTVLATRCVCVSVLRLCPFVCVCVCVLSTSFTVHVYF